MGAVQPFISGAISKTVNLPETATVEDVMEAYIEAWRYGTKAIAIYRDGSKKVQPLSTNADASNAKKKTEVPAAAETVRIVEVNRPERRRLPDTRASLTHKFNIEGHEGYITVGLFEDGTPGELFVTMAKEGSTLSGMMDAFATSVSLLFQHGVPLPHLVEKFSHMRFEPSGWTGNPEIGMATSITSSAGSDTATCPRATRRCSGSSVTARSWIPLRSSSSSSPTSHRQSNPRP
jgi:ribonucleoside-diphosphate reductase alpha chain